MTDTLTSFALQRQQRAAVARVLLQLHEQDALDNPEQWSWQALTELPAWCLMGGADRVALQKVCGAVALGPSLRYWIDRRTIAEGHRLVGAACFERIVQEAENMLTGAMQIPSAHDESSGAVPQPDEVESRLMATGAAVLRATLSPSLSLNSLSESLGEASETVSPAAAEAFLRHAERLMIDVDRDNESVEQQQHTDVA